MIQEKARDAAFLKSYADGDLSFENVVLISGQNLDAGALLGKITASAKYKDFDPDAVDGSQTAASILLSATDATEGDKEVVIVDCLAEVVNSLLIWKAGVDANEKAIALAALRTKFIKAR